MLAAVEHFIGFSKIKLNVKLVLRKFYPVKFNEDIQMPPWI